MAALQLGAPLPLKTSSIGWPVELNIYKIRDDVYFDVTATLRACWLFCHFISNAGSWNNSHKLLSKNDTMFQFCHGLFTNDMIWNTNLRATTMQSRSQSLR